MQVTEGTGTDIRLGLKVLKTGTGTITGIGTLGARLGPIRTGTDTGTYEKVPVTGPSKGNRFLLENSVFFVLLCPSSSFFNCGLQKRFLRFSKKLMISIKNKEKRQFCNQIF